MEKAMGAALPDDVVKEADRQGVLKAQSGPAQGASRLCHNQGNTRSGNRITGFARKSGPVEPLVPFMLSIPKTLAKLSGDQRAMVRHIRHRRIRRMLAYGGAGHGQDLRLEGGLEGVVSRWSCWRRRPMQPGCAASRFPEANTVANS